MTSNSGFSVEIGRIVLVLVLVVVLDFFDPTLSAGQIEDEDDQEPRPAVSPLSRAELTADERDADS